MPLCDTLLRCAEEPALFRRLWSKKTLEEVSRTLVDRFEYSAEQAERRIHVMQEAFPEATVSVPAALLEGIPKIPDPDDKHVVAAAMQGHADVIVTANLKDFPKELLAPYGFEIQSPDEFLVQQFHLNP
jgi:predicted nucleic acid-binding protein